LDQARVGVGNANITGFVINSDAKRKEFVIGISRLLAKPLEQPGR